MPGYSISNRLLLLDKPSSVLELAKIIAGGDYFRFVSISRCFEERRRAHLYLCEGDEVVKNKVTIIIPTHNRHHYLPRSVGWFVHGGYRVIVADSSESEWQHPLREDRNLTYLHIPGSYAVYMQKMNEAIQAVETPLAALCADDDFILYSGLDSCAEFLLSNSDYSFCQGYAYLFQCFSSRVAVWPMPYDFHDVESEFWVDRVLATKSTAYYGVNRVEVLAEIFRFLETCEVSRSMPAAGLVDFVLTAIVSKNGKMKRLQVPFGLREYSMVVNAVGTRPQLILDPALPVFFQGLLAQLKQGKVVSADQEAALVRVIAADFAGQIIYDLIPVVSRRKSIAFLPKNLQSLSEYALRSMRAIRAFLRNGYFPALNLFVGEDFKMFKKQLKANLVK